MENLTFKELMEKFPPKCKCCNELLDWSFQSYVNNGINKLKDVDGQKLKGFYCGTCYIEEKRQLVESRTFEEYNSQKIYEKDGMFFPYWECHYYFKTIEDCRARINAKNLAITPF